MTTENNAIRGLMTTGDGHYFIPYVDKVKNDGDGNVISETYVKKADFGGGFVAKTGDTMSGVLKIATATSGQFKTKNTEVAIGDTPDARVNTGGVYFLDKNDETAALVQSYTEANGKIGIQLITHKPDNSGWGASLDIATDADGNRYLKYNGVDIGYAMPKIGKKSEALAAVNNQVYTAPADGCYTIVATGGNQAYVRLYNQTSGELGHISRTADGGGSCATSMYCSKGDKVQLQITATTANSFKFIYGKNDGV